ncbi:unnamed protein product [Zymoseptoria tritici ST99CH_1A5]|uniref:Uncharacterized protein n=1 Tax=Zymoseptoria tritici ST99CH_1A5 TaxID=1276529 RepID=A0A1Y6L874_ZYMTR|nr:unnamed protein product [Zymoseptoria tritici ST99CH_1A5]
MSRTPSLFQETRVSPSTPSPSHILHINTTDKTPSTTSLTRKRAHSEISSSLLDEDTYARHHLASSASVFFRPAHRSPRSFLHRVLSDRRVLEIQCVDLIQKDKSDCWLTFRIELPAPIVPGGVVLADGGEKDALDVFIVTGEEGKGRFELFTVTLRGGLLVRETVPLDFDGKSVVRRFVPSCFSFRRPYRVVAASSLELFVSLQDGGLMRLRREANDSGANWNETYFSEGGWSGTLKGMLSLRNRKTVDYNGAKVEANAIAAIAPSPDGRFVWTVGLDHVLKAWDTKTGKVVAVGDLLNEVVDVDDRKRQGGYAMGAEQGTLLQIVAPTMDADFADAEYFLVVHSPREHVFKFFGVTSETTADGVALVLRDTMSGRRLIPPVDEMLDTNIWHLEQFYVQAGRNFQGSRIWLRARSGPVCRTFTMAFDLLDDRGAALDLEDAFQHDWSVVDSSSLSVDSLRDLPEFRGLEAAPESSTTPSEKWLDFLFFPGRFSNASLETALNIYRQGRKLPKTSGKGLKAAEEPLKERITSAVSSKILLRRLPNEQPDYDGYQEDVHKEWNTFFTLVSHLHTRRHESIGFAVDAEKGLAWTVCADFVAPIRSSSKFELLHNNAGLQAVENEEQLDREIMRQIWPAEDDPLRSRIMAVAQQFRRFMSPAAQEKLRIESATHALTPNDEMTPADGLQHLYDRCGFANEITDDEFETITTSAECFNGLGTLTEDAFLSVLDDILDKVGDAHKSLESQMLGLYGKDVSIAIAQETILHVQGVLLDSLALVIFMAFELDETELSPEFSSTRVYELIMLKLRETELRLWLVSHLRQEPMKSGAKEADMITMTIYESIFIGDWKVCQGSADSDLAELLTSSSLNWTFGLPLTAQWTNITTFVMANLLKHKEADLAAEFIQFMPEKDSAWSTYLKGRMYLTTGDYALASIHFEEAASDLTQPTNTRLLNQGDLLTPDELIFFGQGPSSYFQHILSLFEKLKLHSYVADFATRALQYMMSDAELTRSLTALDSRKKSAPDSPLPDQVRDAGSELKLLRLQQTRDEILGRLFNALLQTGRFEAAYDTLTQVSNPILQKSNLQSLIKDCVKRDAVPTLLDLPISGDMVHEADKILHTLARQAMASSPLASSSSGPAYHQILFAFRTQHSDFRGAASILYEHLQRLRHNNGSKSWQKMQDPEDETLVRVFVLVISSLACCGEGEGWLLAEPIEGEGKRRCVTLEEVRAEFGRELDRRSEVQLGRFALVGGEGEDGMF